MSDHRQLWDLHQCFVLFYRPDKQNLFPIVQGGLDVAKRKDCAQQLIKRNTPGFAVGGLSGGEAKDDFWRMVHVSTDELPRDKPRYLMGVGFAVDLVVCSALGVDMYDCVFPSRTARFGTALVRAAPGSINLKSKEYAADFRPIEEGCECETCRHYTRAYLRTIVSETASCHLITVHNIKFQLKLMSDVREAIKEDRFPDFVREFMLESFPKKDYPGWTVDALKAVGVTLL